VPLLLYTFGGGGVNAGPQHSQSFAAWFAHVPGLKVVMPSTPADVLGLVKAGIRDDDPVLCLLSKKLIGSSGEVPDPGSDHTIALGTAEIKRPGRDVTLVAIGQMVPAALAAAETLAGDGLEVEVLDPRTVSPLDFATISASVARTRHLVVVQEAHGPCSIASEILARVAESGAGPLKAPPLRLTPPFAPSPFAPPLEKAYLPNVGSIQNAVRELVRQ
jgi:pyruvate dehydrogenase E1 component beta subunit